MTALLGLSSGEVSIVPLLGMGSPLERKSHLRFILLGSGGYLAGRACGEVIGPCSTNPLERKSQIWAIHPFFGSITSYVLGPEILGAGFFAYRWDDQYTMTSILGIHLILLGIGSGLLCFRAISFGGIYDPWSPGGGDVRRVVEPNTAAASIVSYLLSSPFGGDGWIVRVDSLEDIIGGHVVVSVG